MNDIVRFVLGLGVVIGMVGVYGWLSVLGQYKRAKENQIKADVAEFGQCCGLENGVCTLPARLDKLNKIDLNAAKKDK